MIPQRWFAFGTALNPGKATPGSHERKIDKGEEMGKGKSVEGLRGRTARLLLFIVLIYKSAEVSFPCEIVRDKLFTGEPSGLPGASFPHRRSSVLWERSGGATFQI